MSRGLMKAGSDWCLFLPLSEESSQLGLTDDSLDGNDAGGQYDGDLGEWHLGGDDAGDAGGCLTCLWAIKHHGLGVHIAHFIIDVAHFVVERHRSGLVGLMVLKGIVFGLFFPFLHWMVLKGGAVVTYGLQMSSIPSVDSATGALDHVRSSTF